MSLPSEPSPFSKRSRILDKLPTAYPKSSKVLSRFASLSELETTDKSADKSARFSKVCCNWPFSESEVLMVSPID